ncbi:MAG: HDIG domain-containing protein [Candidatus Cloacimonetes bacterium]|jgi:putative nucleotidyltransferase with HDIG domain|nr:HDIG domain-containing protein [Candidatus Cloacimonadota bacterium]
MNSKHILVIILTAFAIVGLYHIFAEGRFDYPQLRLKEGQVAEMEVIAPFDFPVMKPAEQITLEHEQSVLQMNIPYMVDDEPYFLSLSEMDRLWEIFYHNRDADTNALAAECEKAGFKISPESLIFARNSQIRDRIYDSFRNHLAHIYNRGIYDSVTTDSLSIWSGGIESIQPKESFYSKAEALEYLSDSLPAVESMIKEIGNRFVLPNIIEDKDLSSEIKQRILLEIPETEGMILQNEVIIRKNSRVSSSDVVKLESLLEAYKSRGIHKSPFQQMLLAFGMMLYVSMILLVVNHCYVVNKPESQVTLRDYLPVNLAMLIIVVFSVVINHLLSLNNLLIPFAMMAISASILLGVDFAMLFSICSMLIISPFINWETFPPIIFLFSTVTTLILIERQKAQHEYLSIWFYLLISSLMVNAAISIYNNDNPALFLRKLGFSAVSSAISVMGVLVIVPYYEKKWNRATKQTLLELIDFNHPLIKKLATEAVGTYHHSLIVGNLAERAAEAIGANPLLARVGSYYHDIGKIANTEIFTENNENSSEIHDKLPPNQSAGLIKNHVQEGVKLAEEYKIPQPVIDIIKQHHGDNSIRYFYDKAEKMDLPIEPEDYHYPGPRPQSKEAALVMIADIVESTTKSKTITSEEEIEKIIDDTISRLIREGQFSDAPITMKDFSVIKESMLPVLGSIYRKRLDYPQENDKNRD